MHLFWSLMLWLYVNVYINGCFIFSLDEKLSLMAHKIHLDFMCIGIDGTFKVRVSYKDITKISLL